MREVTLKEPEKKQCTTCGKMRKKSDFNMTSRKSYGIVYRYRRGECKFCQRKKRKQYTKDHREEQNKRLRKYYQDHTDYFRKYYRDKKERQNEESSKTV